jgi:GNAT superfamily N-acetyltransferase
MAPDSRPLLRPAIDADVPALDALMQAAIAALLPPFLPPEEVEASFALMGLDRQLIADGTYYVAERDGRIVGSGGWSARATLFGGDHFGGRDARTLDPATEAARIRAMYTHPDCTRQGIGRIILAESEARARRAGFRRVQLAATMAGLPLYRACLYREMEYFRETAPNGVSVPLVRMEKSLDP